MLWRKAAVLSFVCIILVSCNRSEHKAIDKYFNAVQNIATYAMERGSVIVFPETVQSWYVIEIGPESVEPCSWKLAETWVAAIERLHHLYDPRFSFHGSGYYEQYKAHLEKNSHAELHGELAEFRKELIEFEKEAFVRIWAIKKAKREYDREETLREVSLVQGTSKGAEDGTVSTKEALVNVSTPSGVKTYQLTLRRYNLVTRQNKAIPSRWIIYDVQEQEKIGR